MIDAVRITCKHFLLIILSKDIYERSLFEVPMKIIANFLDEEDDFGGEHCKCTCHPTADPSSQHCIHCSLKFINGKVYSREGKTLRLVKVQFSSSSSKLKKKRKKRK